MSAPPKRIPDGLDREADRIKARRAGREILQLVGDEDLFPRSPLEDVPVEGQDPKDEPGDDLRSFIESDCGDR